MIVSNANVFDVKRYVESIIRDYPRTDDYIAERARNMAKAFSKEQSMLGKEVTVKDPKVWALKRDRNLAEVKHNQEVITACLADLTASEREMVAAYFFNGYTTGERVSEELNTSVSTVSRMKNKFMNAVAKRKGLRL